MIVLMIALMKSHIADQSQEVTAVAYLDLLLVHMARVEVALNQFLSLYQVRSPQVRNFKNQKNLKTKNLLIFKTL